MGISDASGGINVITNPIKRIFGKNIQIEKKIKVFLEGEVEAVDKFISYTLAQQKAILKRETPTGKLYEIVTEEGKVEVDTNIKPVNGKVSVNIRIEGSKKGTKQVHDKITSELDHFKGE